ncbi:MAG: GTPase ObgE [Erysipelotrichaceae bacterium]|nr:GTPase ObgE [Erysipelotrichaceae bacterium]MDY5252323.1 GTPase ObgE [Erysipelotrichaceae bacterium]
MFVDRVVVKLKAGNGGNGIVSFRREAHVPLGGPNGGDGGKGGSIYFVVDTNKSTLLDLRYNKKIVAKNGENGKSKKMHGASGADIYVKVPQGTMIKDANTNELICDLCEADQSYEVCKGGRGGRGNYHFASGKDNAPEYAEQGTLGESKDVVLELKLLADVGLIGFPSVGKSTLLSVVSKARPEIADYPFTTLVPNLGVVQVKDGRSFVMADLPGLIEGASQGKGLGIQFLKHIERCRVLVHVIDMGANDGRDPLEDYRIINEELKQYHMRLSERPQIVVANKMDLDDAQANLARFKASYPDVEVFETMTIIHEGIDQLLYKCMDLLEKTPSFPLVDEQEKEERVVYKYRPKDPIFTISNLGNGQYRVNGDKIVQLFKNTNFDDEKQALNFAVTMKKIGVDEALRQAGAKDGDVILIDDYRLEFVE